MKQPRPPRILTILMTFAVIFAVRAFSQELKTNPQLAACSNESNLKAHYRALREIEDPGTHQRWLLIQDQERAAGPAFFVRELRPSWCASFVAATTNSPSHFAARLRQLPVIHAGDAVLLSAHTKISDAEFEAIALGPAAAGDPLRVRLKFGGFTARAIATAPGRVTLADEVGGRRP